MQSAVTTSPGAPSTRSEPHHPPLTAGSLVDGVSRLGVLRASALGDFVQALPAFEALRAAYSAAELVLVGTPTHAALVAGRSSPVDRVIPLPVGALWHTGRALRAHGDAASPVAGAPPEIRPAEIIQTLRAERFDLVVQLHGGGGETNPVAAALEAPVTAGAVAPGARPLDRSIPFVHYQSETLRALEVVGLVGAPPVTLEPRLAVTAADRAAAAQVLRGDARWAVLHPGASDPRRRWAPERFAAVGDDLARRGLSVAITGVGRDEADIASEVAAWMRTTPAVLVDRLSLPALVGVLATARLVVANDTGPLHLAAAVGTPTVGIYWFGNLITGAPPFRARTRPVVAWRPSCPACGADATETRGCDHGVSFVDDVGVDAVESAIEELLGLEG